MKSANSNHLKFSFKSSAIPEYSFEEFLKELNTFIDAHISEFQDDYGKPFSQKFKEVLNEKLYSQMTTLESTDSLYVLHKYIADYIDQKNGFEYTSLSRASSDKNKRKTTFDPKPVHR